MAESARRQVERVMARAEKARAEGRHFDALQLMFEAEDLVERLAAEARNEAARAVVRGIAARPRKAAA
jgi:hypothetical protein